VDAAPLECYIMQGEYALPAPVVEKFARTSGDIAKHVFLLSECSTCTRLSSSYAL
jgi:hypothetical protein